MRDYVERLLLLYNTPSGKRMFRYTMVSVISTGISFAALILIYGVFKLWTQVPSTLVSNLTGVLPSYYLNRNWAWGKAGKSHVTREVLPFWIASVLGILASAAAAAEARHISVGHHLHHTSSTVLVVGANVLAFSVLWVFKFMVFNRLFHVTPEAEAEQELEAETELKASGADVEQLKAASPESS